MFTLQTTSIPEQTVATSKGWKPIESEIRRKKNQLHKSNYAHGKRTYTAYFLNHLQRQFKAWKTKFKGITETLRLG